MPSRSVVLATGLVPVPVLPEEQCSICFDAFTDPVRLPCHHTHKFCKECIAHWLKSSDLCPMCKTVLLHPKASSPLTREALVRRAFWMVNHTGQPPETFETGPSAMPRRVMPAVFDVREYLVYGRHPTARNQVQDRVHGWQTITGPGSFNAEYIGPAYVMLGRLIPALAAVQGRTYTSTQLADWDDLLEQLWPIIRMRDGESVSRVELCAKAFRKNLIKSLRKHHFEVDNIEFFYSDESVGSINLLSRDLDILLDFVAFLAWRQHHLRAELIAREEEQARAARKAIMKRLKDKASCVIM